MNSDIYHLTLPKYKELKYFIELIGSRDIDMTDFAKSKIKDEESTCYLIQDKRLGELFSGIHYRYCAVLNADNKGLIKEYQSSYHYNRKFVPVIRDKDFIKNRKLEDGKAVKIGRTPARRVEHSLEQELNKVFLNGTLLYTDSKMKGYPEFYYNGNTYVPEFPLETDNFKTSEIFKLMKSKIYNQFGEPVGFHWFKVDNIYFIYFKKFNVLISDTVLDVYNSNLSYRLDELSFMIDVEERLISKELPDKKLFLSIDDYDNYDKVKTESNDNKCIDVIVEDLHSINPLIMTKEYEKDGLKLIEFGEYPLKVTNLPLEGVETGKVYHFPNISPEETKYYIEECKEYYDSKRNIKYAKIGTNNYIIEPLLWIKGVNNNNYKLKNISFKLIDGFNYRKYITKYFLKEIIPSKVKNDVHEVINSNIGYQLLMNKNNINESDLELDEGNKLVLKK